MKNTITKLALACMLMAGSTHAQTILSQNFESLTTPAIPAGWTNVHTGSGLGWVSATPATFSYGTGHTQFAAVYESAGGNRPAILTTSSFSFSGITHPYLSYDVWFANASTGTIVDTMERAYVQLTTNGGATWNTVDSMGDWAAWQTRNVSLMAYAGAATVSLRFVYTDNGTTSYMYGAAVDNIRVYDRAASDLALTVIHPDAASGTSYIASGTAVNFTGKVTNRGYNTITAFVVTYQQGANPAVNYNVTGVSIAPDSVYSFTDAMAYTMPATAGDYPFHVWVTAVADTTVSNDTLLTQLTVPSFFPTKIPVFECATGTWGGWNVRGIVYMDSLQRVHTGNVAIINVHDADTMAHDNLLTRNYDNYMAMHISGYPSTIVDRRVVQDPQTALADYTASMATFGFASVTSAPVTMVGDSAFIPVTVTPAIDMSGDYRLELALIEDSVHGNDTSFSQANYYSYMSMNMPLAETGFNYQALTSHIPSAYMYYSSVARATVPDMNVSPNGVAGSLPATMTAGTPYNYSFDNVNLPTNWITTRMRAVIMLIDNATGNILNSQNSSYFPHREGHGGVLVSNVSNISGINLYPNPASDETILQLSLTSPATVSVAVYDAVGRNVYSVAAATMQQGTQSINIPTAQLATGVYQVKVSTPRGTVVKALSVIK